MRGYQITGIDRAADGEMTVTRFGGSMADARTWRNTIVNDYDGIKKSEVKIEEIEIPTSKAELLEFINNLL